MTNQWLKQIPPHIGWYFAGFADGEGSFNVSLRRKDYSVGWQLCPSFNVSQRDITVLALYKRWLKCGTLRTRQDGVVYYEVISIPALKEVILPFFEKYNFLSASKKKNFSIFRKIIELMAEGKHLKQEGFREILELREILNQGKGRKRKYELQDVIESK
mgnify:CR=1 FL=1